MSTKNKILAKKFFERSAVVVAEDLIGKTLIKRRKDGNLPDGQAGIERFVITETEAYEGIEDLASHASKGRTKRTEVMFGEAGVFYVYLVYGMYHMLNVVTGLKDHPAAVLIRGIQKERSKDKKTERLKLNGPGKVTRFLNIDKAFNALPATLKTGLWFEGGGIKIDKKQIKKATRVGVTYAGPVWSNKLWRFVCGD